MVVCVRLLVFACGRVSGWAVKSSQAPAPGCLGTGIGTSSRGVKQAQAPVSRGRGPLKFSGQGRLGPLKLGPKGEWAEATCVNKDEFTQIITCLCLPIPVQMTSTSDCTNNNSIQWFCYVK